MLTVVTGPPCAGKSTYVAQHRTEHSLVVDLDTIAHALGYPDSHVAWNVQHPALSVARSIRSLVIRDLTKGRIVAEAWIIDSRPDPISLRIYTRVGARVVNLDPGKTVCLDRAQTAGRDADTLDRIERWYGSGRSSSQALDIFG